MIRLCCISLAALLCTAPLHGAVAADITIKFDKVKVTAAAGTGAAKDFTIYSAEALADGPFKTTNGAGPLPFLAIGPGGRTYAPGFTGATIFANQWEFRYFGSVEAPKGSILVNGTDSLFNSTPDTVGYKIDKVDPKDVGGFEIKLAQPDKDDIKVAEGGNAFKTVKIADDKNSVSFSEGLIKPIAFPAVGASGEFLWSVMTTGDQPKFPQVMFTDPKIPPDPAGEFKTLRYVGKAVPVPGVPEPGTWSLSAAGLLIMSMRMRRVRHARRA